MKITNFFALCAFALALVTNHCKNSGTLTLFEGSFRDTRTMLHSVSKTQWDITYPGVGVCSRLLKDYKSSEGFALYTESGNACFNNGKAGQAYFTNDTSGNLWYCDLITGKSSLSEVTTSTLTADSASPATGGCNGKAWIQLTAMDSNLALVGNFSDPYGGSQKFTNTLWTGSYGTPCNYQIIFYDNINGFFVYQQQGDAGCTSANNYKFGKVFWGVSSASEIYYCELLYGQTYYLTVTNSTAKPTYTNPAASGCSTFSWTKLTRD